MAVDDGRGRRWTLLLIGTLAAGLLALLVGVGEQRVAITEAFGDPGSTVLELGVASCNANPRIEVEETASTVTVTVFLDRPGILDGQDDCLDGARVTLSSPLGTRAVVDGSSGAVLTPSAPD